MAKKTAASSREGRVEAAVTTITLSNLKPAPGSTQSRKRVGRGPGLRSG